MMIRIKSSCLTTPRVFAAGWYDLTKEKMVPGGRFLSVATGLIWPTLSLRIRVLLGRVLKPVVLGIIIALKGDGLELYTPVIGSNLPT